MSDPTRPDGEIIPASEPKPSDVDAALGRAMEAYANNPILRGILATSAAVLAAAHSVGQYAVMVGVADFIASNRAQGIAAERTRKLIEGIAREAKEVREGMIRADYFHSEEWHDLFRRAVEANAKIGDDARRAAIARILVAAATGTLPDVVEPEALAAVLGEMTENEAALLGALWKTFGRDGDRLELTDGWAQSIGPRSLAERGEFLLHRLVARGLLGLQTSLRRFGSHFTSFSGTKEETYFTPTGAVLMLYYVNDPSPSKGDAAQT
jgi:hypothetical protein